MEILCCIAEHTAGCVSQNSSESQILKRKEKVANWHFRVGKCWEAHVRKNKSATYTIFMCPRTSYSALTHHLWVQEVSHQWLDQQFDSSKFPTESHLPSPTPDTHTNLPGFVPCQGSLSAQWYPKLC